MQLPKLQYQQNSESFVNETEETKEDFPRMHQISNQTKLYISLHDSKKKKNSDRELAIILNDHVACKIGVTIFIYTRNSLRKLFQIQKLSTSTQNASKINITQLKHLKTIKHASKVNITKRTNCSYWSNKTWKKKAQWCKKLDSSHMMIEQYTHTHIYRFWSS